MMRKIKQLVKTISAAYVAKNAFYDGEIARLTRNYNKVNNRSDHTTKSSYSMGWWEHH